MQLGVDVGGTFTDAALVTGDRLFTAKVATTPRDQSDGVIVAIELVLSRANADRRDVERFVHGMTVGTNALLEGNVARTALLATEGFTDLEELGRQARAALYRLCQGHPAPLVPAQLRVGVRERMGPHGLLQPLDEGALRESIDSLLEQDIESVAVCLLWGFRHPEHERRVAQLIARARPSLHVSTSHETAAVFREYERCVTTLVDAALSPLLSRYLERLSERARESGLPDPEVMLSGGGVLEAGAAGRHGSWTVLSGPAAGATGAAWVAAASGRGADAVCLDMGGTSCDVSVTSSGRVAETGGREVGGRALVLPMVDVHTIGAGGGSLAWRDAGGALRVGPRSAGARPGPACYGFGGDQPTVTDANLVLGYLDPATPLAGDIVLDRARAEQAIGALADELELSMARAAAGIVEIASAEMARAVRVMTVERGVDPRELMLLAFGGAGPLHATAIAEELEMPRVLIPHSSGVLSALGLIVSERRRDLVESVLLSGADLTCEAIGSAVSRLIVCGRGALAQAGVSGQPIEARAAYDLRYAGQAFELTVSAGQRPDPADLRARFDAAHQKRYGFADPDAELELVTIRLAVASPGADLGSSLAGAAEEALMSTRAAAEGAVTAGSADAEEGRLSARPALFDGATVECAVLRGTSGTVSGPAIWDLPEATLVVRPGWVAGARDDGTILVERR